MGDNWTQTGVSPQRPQRPQRPRRRPLSAREIRETAADLLMLAGAVALLVSLFLVWSRQGPPTLPGVPAQPTAWQVYSAADVLLALLAAALAYVAFAGTRPARLLALLPVAAGLAFAVHAAGAPPANGANVPGAVTPTGGPGETVAIVALGAALAGLGLSFTAD